MCSSILVGRRGRWTKSSSTPPSLPVLSVCASSETTSTFRGRSAARPRASPRATATCARCVGSRPRARRSRPPTRAQSGVAHGGVERSSRSRASFARGPPNADGGAALAALVARDLRGETPLHVAARRGSSRARDASSRCGIAADVTARGGRTRPPRSSRDNARAAKSCERFSPRARGRRSRAGSTSASEPRERNHVRYLSGRARQRDGRRRRPRLQKRSCAGPLPHRVHRDVAAAVGRVPVLQAARRGRRGCCGRRWRCRRGCAAAETGGGRARAPSAAAANERVPLAIRRTRPAAAHDARRGPVRRSPHAHAGCRRRLGRWNRVQL